MINIFKIIGAIGLILIIAGILTKKRNIQDIYYIIGASFLEVYSIYIKDTIFMVLQFVFILAVVYDSVKVRYLKK